MTLLRNEIMVLLVLAVIIGGMALECYDSSTSADVEFVKLGTFNSSTTSTTNCTAGESCAKMSAVSSKMEARTCVPDYLCTKKAGGNDSCKYEMLNAGGENQEPKNHAWIHCCCTKDLCNVANHQLYLNWITAIFLVAFLMLRF